MLSARNSGVVWVAERGGAVVGFSAWGPAREPREAHVDAELYAIYQEHHALGTGVGGRLLAATVEDMRQAGHRWAMLWVLETNERARGFYEHYGWHADGAMKRETVHGLELQEVRYSLVL
jgi:GNAT superfamily N-acetyltransferase